MRFVVFTLLKMSWLVFQVVRSCGLVGRYQHCLEHDDSMFLQNVDICANPDNVIVYMFAGISFSLLAFTCVTSE